MMSCENMMAPVGEAWATEEKKTKKIYDQARDDP